VSENHDYAFAVVIPAGPGPQEFGRIADTLDSLNRFEPDVARVIIVDDGAPEDPDLLAAAGPLADRTTVIRNPRSRDAHGWSEGVLVGIAAGLDEALSGSPDVDWVLRMDSDALIIGPFAATIGDRFASDRAIGMVGTYLRDADGAVRDFTRTGRPVRRLHAPISLWRSQRAIKTSLFGVGRERRRVIDAARANGYEYGQHCQGGAYAMSTNAIAAIAAEGWLDCRLWKGTFVSEDLVMAIQLEALGFRMEGMADPGEPFAVRHVGLPADPRTLRDAGYAIAHSLKSHDGVTEQELRDEFRSLRLETTPTES
jgi:glycosyltransferase involved in cell wall biosynthesis